MILPDPRARAVCGRSEDVGAESSRSGCPQQMLGHFETDLVPLLAYFLLVVVVLTLSLSADRLAFKGETSRSRWCTRDYRPLSLGYARNS